MNHMNIISNSFRFVFVYSVSFYSFQIIKHFNRLLQNDVFLNIFLNKFRIISKNQNVLSTTFKRLNQREVSLSHLYLKERNGFGLSQNKFISSSNENSYEETKKYNINEETKSRNRWTKKEEEAVISKEIQIRKQNPKITEKQMNHQLSIAFDNNRTVGSFASKRRSTKWKLMVQNEMNSFSEKDSKNNLNCDDLKDKIFSRLNHDSQSKNIVGPGSDYAPSDEVLMQMANILKFQEGNSNILEKEATGKIEMHYIIWKALLYLYQPKKMNILLFFSTFLRDLTERWFGENRRKRNVSKSKIQIME